MIEVSTKYVKLFLPQLADSPAGTSVMLVSCSRSIKYAKLCLAVVFTTNRSVIKVLGVVAGNGPRQWCYVAILRFKRRNIGHSSKIAHAFCGSSSWWHVLFFGSCFVALPFFLYHGRSPNMIYKVLYQKDKIQNPRRETTQTLYLEAPSAVEARALVEANTPYNIEFIQELSGNFLEYEEKSANFKLTTF